MFERVPDRQRIEQRLGRVLVTAVTRVEHRAIHLVRDQPDRPRAAVADHDRIGAHRVERHRGVDQRFALLHARLRGVHVDDIGAEPLARDLERQQRARRVFEEGVDDGEARQQIRAFLRLPVELDPVLGLVEEIKNLVPRELSDPGQVAVLIGKATRGIAAGEVQAFGGQFCGGFR